MVSPKTKAALILGLVFVLGIGTGGASAFAIVQRRHAAMLRDDVGVGGGAGPAMLNRRMRVLTRKLDLDSVQEEKINAIFQRDAEESFRLGETMFENCGEPLRTHRKKTDDEVRAVLRPDQVSRYEDLAKRGRFPGPPPFPGRHEHGPGGEHFPPPPPPPP